jgi:hypothetical protein
MGGLLGVRVHLLELLGQSPCDLMQSRLGRPLCTVQARRTPFSYGQPIETIEILQGLEIPLQTTSEALTFYAAYRARNYRAMAAVGAMSAWGGTLRRGIYAVAGSSDEASMELWGS